MPANRASAGPAPILSIISWTTATPAAPTEQRIKIVDCRSRRRSARVQVNDESTVETEDSSGRLRDEELQHQWNGYDVQREREAIKCNGQDEDDNDPLDIPES